MLIWSQQSLRVVATGTPTLWTTKENARQGRYPQTQKIRGHRNQSTMERCRTQRKTRFSRCRAACALFMEKIAPIQIGISTTGRRFALHAIIALGRRSSAALPVAQTTSLSFQTLTASPPTFGGVCQSSRPCFQRIQSHYKLCVSGYFYGLYI